MISVDFIDKREDDMHSRFKLENMKIIKIT